VVRGGSVVVVDIELGGTSGVVVELSMAEPGGPMAVVWTAPLLLLRELAVLGRW